MKTQILSEVEETSFNKSKNEISIYEL